jgi:shikimate 5-dehydrogenase
MRKFGFEAPEIIGILGGKSIPKGLESSISREISRQRKPFVCLPFKVERRYLGNVLDCMRLMDITGLIIVGEHTGRMEKFVKDLDKSAKEAGKINLIKYSRGKFTGYHFDQKSQFFHNVVKFLTSP